MHDIIVVGGGIIGLSCAWRLAQKGHRVAVFDARELAGEASWAGAGMLAPGGEYEADSAQARMAVKSLGQYASFVEELSEASGRDIDFHRDGALEIAFSESEAAALARRAQSQAAMGIISEAADFRGASAARFYPADAVVNPRDVTAALRVACERLGVALHEYEAVETLSGTGVKTGKTSYEAGAVLIAAGAWSSGLCPEMPASRPVRGHLMAFPPSETSLGTSILRHNHTYLLRRRDGTIIAGTSSEEVGFDRSLDAGLLTDIERRARLLLPDLPQPNARWNGFRPAIDGDVPVIGKIGGSGVWAACGHYRNGILLAPETARQIAELMP